MVAVICAKYVAIGQESTPNTQGQGKQTASPSRQEGVLTAVTGTFQQCPPKQPTQHSTKRTKHCETASKLPSKHTKYRPESGTPQKHGDTQRPRGGPDGRFWQRLVDAARSQGRK